MACAARLGSPGGQSVFDLPSILCHHAELTGSFTETESQRFPLDFALLWHFGTGATGPTPLHPAAAVIGSSGDRVGQRRLLVTSRHAALCCDGSTHSLDRYRYIKVHIHVLVVYVPFVANAMCGDDVDRDPSHLPAPSWLNRRWPSPVAQCACAPTLVEQDSPRHGRQERLRCESIHPSIHPPIHPSSVPTRCQ